MRQLTRLTLKEEEALPQYFIRAQELSTRLVQAVEHLSEPLLNAMVLNALPERYEHSTLWKFSILLGVLCS